MTDLLLRTNLSDRQARFASTIQQSGKNLLTIVNDILEISRIEGDKIELDVHDFDLEACVQEAVELLAEDAHRKGLDLSLYFDAAAAGTVRGDSGRLRQVLLNLLGNAIKFTPVGKVTVRVEAMPKAGNRAIRLEVRDTGVGISPEILAKLCQPFVQGDASISRRYGGSGLGLSISRHLVDKMGGNLQIESTLGAGTTVHFVLTLPEQAGLMAELSLPRLERRRMLVVDDCRIDREIVGAYLAATGAWVDQAEGGAQALERLRAAAAGGKPYELVLADAAMPGMDGLELAKRVRSSAPLAGTPFILLSSLSWVGEEPRLRKARLDAHLHKPLRRVELITTVADILCNTAAETAQDADATAALPAAPLQAGNPTEFNVLVAEDNPVNQVVVEEYLTRFGCRCRVVENGKEALAALENNRFDMVFMDCQMPEMDGIAATRAIRQREQQSGGRQTPIVALTANAYDEDRRICFDAGMTGFVAKPFTEQELLDEVKRWGFVADATAIGSWQAAGNESGQDERHAVGAKAAPPRQRKPKSAKDKPAKRAHAKA